MSSEPGGGAGRPGRAAPERVEASAHAGAPPRVAVLIATVHRPQDVVVAVESVLACDYPDFEVRIVDQNTGSESLDALGGWLEDPRVGYLRHDAGGLSAALNAGAAATDADILAITGDDCTVSGGWLRELAACFEADPRLGVLFGSVLSGPYDGDDGFVPGCVISETVSFDGLAEIHRLNGTTANMAVLRSVWMALCGFDETLGVGADFRSAEDLDLALRALSAGYRVLQTPRVETTHHSPTTWTERPRTIRRNWYGSGAALAKALKLRPGPMLRALAGLARRWGRGGSQVAATYGPRPDRLGMLVGFGSGFIAGLIRRIDPVTRHFR